MRLAMDIVWICGCWAMITVGVIGCFLPVLPGPPIAFCALLLARLVGDHTAPSITCLVLSGGLTVFVTILDYIVPAIGARTFKCSKAGIVGCALGTLVGLFFLPFGVIVGPFVGALIGEIGTGKRLGSSFLGAVGALLGYLFGIVIKLGCCGVLAYTLFQATH